MIVEDDDSMRQVQVKLAGNTVIIGILCDDLRQAKNLLNQLQDEINEGHLRLELDWVPWEPN
jgi:hypothetical protein